MAKFKFQPLLLDSDATTARLGDGAAGANPLSEADKGKFVKLVGDSQYGLCAAGDEIEGVVQTVDYPAKSDGFILGGVMRHNSGPVPRRLRVTFGAVLTINDLVVAGAVTARGTKLPGYHVVNKAAAPGKFNWRVVSLDGTTAIGQTGLIEAI